MRSLPSRLIAIAVVVAAGIVAVPSSWRAPGIHAQGSVQSPIATWSSNEGTGNRVGDRYGTHTGIIAGATWTPGKYGQALDFDGNDDVSIGDFDQAESFTVMAWIQPRSLVTLDVLSLMRSR